MSHNNPLVSVIIPSYNRARFVVKAIDSVLAQTYGNREIIVVDSSTDDTAEVLKPYMDRIRYLYQKRAGISAARNLGIREARGEWVALLDSDDEWTPRRLEAAVDAVQARPDLVAHFTNMSIEMPGRDPVNLFQLRQLPRRGEGPWVLETPLVEQLRHQFCFSSNSFVSRKAVLDAGLFDETLTLHEDLDLFLRLAVMGPWGISGEVMARLIRREEAPDVNLSRQRLDRPVYAHECLVRVYSKLSKNERLDPQERALVNERLSGARFNLGMVLLKEGQRLAGLDSVRQSFLDSLSAKSLAKYAVVKLGGKAGVSLIERGRSVGTKGFRRSDSGH